MTKKAIISEDEMRNYWNAFSKSHSKIDFINTSGGVHYADSYSIQRNHGLSWEFMNKLTGKKIIADCGYGVNGAPDNNGAPVMAGKIRRNELEMVLQ